MYFKKVILTSVFAISIYASIAQETKPRSIGRQYSKKLMDQEKYFDDLKKPNGEKYGNKELALEIKVTPSTEISLDNNNRTIEIKTWDEPKVKIVTNVYFDGASTNLNSEVWLEKLKISTKLLGNSLRIKTDALNNGSSNGSKGFVNNEDNGVEVYSVDGKYIKTEPVKRKVVIIYVPKNNKLNIETKYADIAVSDYIKKLDIDVISGSVQLEKVTLLTLRSKYSNVSINELQSGEIDFINGNLEIATLGEAEVETKYSTVDILTANKLVLKSTNDEYNIEEVNTIEATKEYGSCRINKLNETIQFDGINADIKIKTINASAKIIAIDNKYAAIKLPLKQIKNFSFSYDGPYSTIYKSNTWGNDGNEDSKVSTSDIANSKYKHIAGSGSDTKITIKCQNCSVDCR